jgi:hypothetical protein
MYDLLRGNQNKPFSCREKGSGPGFYKIKSILSDRDV